MEGRGAAMRSSSAAARSGRCWWCCKGHLWPSGSRWKGRWGRMEALSSELLGEVRVLHAELCRLGKGVSRCAAMSHPFP
eukprot:4073899-Prorocentrum_lima.AAC.1